MLPLLPFLLGVTGVLCLLSPARKIFPEKKIGDTWRWPLVGSLKGCQNRNRKFCEVLVYNGEIYNFRSLLPSAKSDGEALLPLYLERGPLFPRPSARLCRGPGARGDWMPRNKESTRWMAFLGSFRQIAWEPASFVFCWGGAKVDGLLVSFP